MPSAPDRRFAQYWYVDDDTDSHLEVKNHLDSPLVLVVRLRLADGEKAELEPFTVGAFATMRIGLKDRLDDYLERLPGAPEPLGPPRWGDGSRPRSLLGSAEVVPVYPRGPTRGTFQDYEEDLGHRVCNFSITGCRP
ncbi:hypothetical protein ACRYCC_28095 [Actinomadura scrupuli]|uniref:hypothetical protein n=1 Tax=Actinomadura scrupuli TaxID=559629 RepID=UPI003D96331D